MKEMTVSQVSRRYGIPSSLEKKRFCGGLYAAHIIPFGNFDEWDAFLE
ncbi:hypothetical protein [uncultured Clostridium sp.]|nr:hypothetical protein [uncultured Clostridium sp.]